MIFAGFFDPSNNGWDIGDVAAILGFIVLLVGAVYGALRWFSSVIRGIVREEVADRTQPIQPNYRNGGQSLADVAAKVDLLVSHLGLDKK